VSARADGDDPRVFGGGQRVVMGRRLSLTAHQLVCHAHRVERARAFGLVAAEYERGRPGYAAEAIGWLLGDQPLGVVDLGAGTGKLSEALVAAGHRVTAVEPLAEMRAILQDRVPGARALDGTAEETGLPDACADAVVAGSAFHWFDRARAFPEIIRILRAPGVVGLLGNGFDSSVQWVARLREILGGSRLGRPGHWPSDDELLEYFDSVQEREFPHEQIVDPDLLRDLALSRSSIATLEAVEQEELLKRVAALWVNEPELQGRDRARLGYLTRVRRCFGVHQSSSESWSGERISPVRNPCPSGE
jgi:SAM-dependent methyltransferase